MRYKIIIFLLFAFQLHSGAQIKSLLKKVNINEVIEVVKDETVRQLEKSRDEYDPTDFNYAVSFSDNSGVFESEAKFRKYQKGLLYALEPESMTDLSPRERAQDYNDVGEMLYASGKYHSAELSFLAARFIQEYEGLTNTKQGARVIANLGLIYHTLGKYSEAGEFTRQAMGIQKDIINDLDGYGASVNNLAVLNKDLGNLKEAEDLFNFAIVLARDTKGAESAAMAIVKNNRAILYQLQGKYETAEKELLRAIYIASSSLKEKSPNFVRMKVNLALLYQLQGEYDKAEKIYLEAINIKKKRLGTGHPDYAVMLRNLAGLYMEKGEREKVEDLLVKSVKIFEKKFGEEHPAYASSITDLARYYLSQGKAEKAGELAGKAIGIQSAALGEHHPNLNLSMETLATANWQTGNIDNAAEGFSAVMQEYIYQVQNFFPPMSEYDKTKFWNRLQPSFINYYNFVLDAQQELPSLREDMYNYHIATKALLLNSTSRVRNEILGSNDAGLKEMYNEWVDLKKFLSTIYTMSEEEIREDKINLDSLEYAANDIERKLSSRSKVFSEGFIKNEAGTKEIAFALSDGEACLEIVRVPASMLSTGEKGLRYAALLLDNDRYSKPSIAVFNDGEKMETEIIADYRVKMQGAAENTGFYKELWGELDKLSAGHKIIYVSLDGIYNQVNLNTLQDDKGMFLADKKDLVYVVNTKMVPGIAGRAKHKPGKEKAVLFGDPNYAKGFDWDKAKTMPMPELPGTKKEVEQINSRLRSDYWNTKMLLKDEAVEEEIKKIRDPFLLHIATHGYFMEDRNIGSDKVFGIAPEQALQNPLLRSGLLFTGADNTIQSIGKPGTEGGDDGILNAFEAMFLDLENTDMVVLSACETGLGEIRNGEGVYGLQRAFQIAGTSNLMISLWQVSDAVTQELMNLFYDSWLGSGDKYQAFKYAQAKIKEKYPAPFYWGAFIMVNN